jgi:glycosyltransferase involved in cell wall biosynthesis
MKKKKFIFFFEDSRYGGPIKRSLLIAKYFKSLKLQTMFIASAKNSKKFRIEIKKLKLKFRFINIHSPQKKIWYLLKYFLFYFYEILKIKNIITSKNFDFYFIYGTYQLKSLFIALYLKKKIIWYLEETHGNYFLIKLFKFFLAKKSLIVCVSRKVRSYFFNRMELLDYDVNMINVGIDTNEFKLNCFSKKKTLDIVSISGYSKPKGIINLVNLCLKLKQLKKKYKIHVLADPIKSQTKNINYVKNQIKKYELDNIIIYDKFIDVNKFYEKSNLFLCLSNSEGGPLTVWEAMSKGKVVISYNVGAVSEIIENGYDGFIVNTNDLNQVIKKIDFITKNYYFSKKIGLRARKKIQNKLDYKITSEKLLRLIDNKFK